MNYISTTEFTSYNPEVDVSLYTTPTLSGILTRASSMVDDYLGYTLQQEDITAEKLSGMVDSDNNLVIITRKRPINSISAVNIVKGTYSASVDLTDGAGSNKYDIPVTAERVIFPGGDITLQSVSVIDWGELRTTEFFVTISYNAGYAAYAIPAVFKDATQLFALDIIGRKQNLTGAKMIRQGGITMSFSERNGKSDLVTDAESLLRDYQRVSLV